MAEVSAEPVKRRRRKVSARRKPVTWREYWRGSQFGRHLFAGMTLVAAAYAGAILWETRVASRIYPPVKVGMTESEVRYLLGAPGTVEGGGRIYRYSDKARELAARFSSARTLDSISCAAGTASPPTCPKILGIGIGTSEYDLLRRLGLPSREVFSGNEKTMFYDGMGLSFRLHLLEVTQLELHRGAGVIGFLPHALLAMVP